MASRKPRKKEASFETEGRLLQELGERLVARADVALMELIKNSYDADAGTCAVVSSDQSIEIRDDGHGMTEQEFLSRWMRIATARKQQRRQSRLFKRTVTGSKGIGRFAVRFLGEHLRLETIARDPSTKRITTLSADFDWPAIDSQSVLREAKIPYRVVDTPGKEPGTCLTIAKLRDAASVDLATATRTELLALVDPYRALQNPAATRGEPAGRDPGFALRLPVGTDDGNAPLAESILANAYARLTIKHTKKQTRYLIKHKDGRTAPHQEDTARIQAVE